MDLDGPRGGGGGGGVDGSEASPQTGRVVAERLQCHIGPATVVKGRQPLSCDIVILRMMLNIK